MIDLEVERYAQIMWEAEQEHTHQRTGFPKSEWTKNSLSYGCLNFMATKVVEEIRKDLMVDDRTEKLIRENERMRTALKAIRLLAENAVMGSWRFKVAAIVDEGLKQ